MSDAPAADQTTSPGRNFDPSLSDADVDRVLSFEPFCGMDPDKFAPSAPLRDIVRNEMRILRFDEGDIVIREGDYGTSAFLLISGAVDVIMPSTLSAEILGRGEVKKKSVLRAMSQLWSNPKLPEVNHVSGLPDGTAARGAEGGLAGVFIEDAGTVLAGVGLVRLEQGQLFGEIAALTRAARTTSIVAAGEVEVLEIRRQAVREIRRRVATFREYVDHLYRSHTLITHLQNTPIFSHLGADLIKTIAEATVFESYGDFDWHISFNRLADASSQERLAEEPVIAEEGNYPDGLLLLRSGFARVTERISNGERTLGYIGTGATYGFEEIAQHYRSDNDEFVPLGTSLRAVGYADILRVPTSIIEAHVLPTLPEHLWPVSRATGSNRAVRRGAWSPVSRPFQAHSNNVPDIETALIEHLVENRYINGSATMLIDLDRCIRCDACLEACAKGHDNNPRFVRHGQRYDRYMVANACMHCVDPVCMIGCPTGAIHRDRDTGSVVINDATCIGCSTCANNCPYDNIRMVEVRDTAGGFLRSAASGDAQFKATKCDLCLEQVGGPACQRACPHDALVRLDMQDLPSLATWLDR